VGKILVLIALLFCQPSPPDGWRYFLPLVAAAQPYKGLAFADPAHAGDLDALGVSWWYDWTPTGDVPMLWRGNPSKDIPRNYAGWILVFNEPNLVNQSNLPPAEAARRLQAVREYYPKAKLLCCGLSVWATDWLGEFLIQGVWPDAWHVHAYTEAWISPAIAQDFLYTHQVMTGGTYWITEYGSPGGSLRDFKTMTRWFEQQEWIERIAAYTNRQPPGAWNIGQGVEMVKPDGSLTEIGAYYQSFR
jgi:hypothetical protein